MTRLSFEVLGIAAPQGSLRPIVSKTTGRTFVKDSNARTRPWRHDVAGCARAALGRLAQPWPIDRPVRVELAFWLPRPKGHFGKKGLRPAAPLYPAGRPDSDKLARACLDSLTGLCWRDDAQVVQLAAEKLYVYAGESPRAVVTVVALEETVGAQAGARAS